MEMYPVLSLYIINFKVNWFERTYNDVRVMVFNTTFNNISVILWQSVLMVEETGENHRPAASHW